MRKVNWYIVSVISRNEMWRIKYLLLKDYSRYGIDDEGTGLFTVRL